MSRILNDVALVCTVFNEKATVRSFLHSLSKMTALPAEFVVVDGGSTDGTVDILEEAARTSLPDVNVRIIVDPQCNIRYTPGPIARGRNSAIRTATKPLIAVTDAGCAVDPGWLEEVTTPLRSDPSVAMSGGWYEPQPATFFEQCQAYAYFRSVNSVDAASFLPSSRSVAFRRTTWEEVGGYPETALAAEDTLFDLAVRRSSGRIVFSPRAVVYWKMRPTLRTYAVLIYRYGFGDGFCRILPLNPLRNLIKLATAAVLLFTGILVHWSAFLLLLVYWWLLPFLSRPQDAFRWEFILRYPLIALLKVVSDAAYVTGYAKGLMTNRHPEFRRILDATEAETPRA